MEVAILILILCLGKEVAEQYAASVGAQHFYTSAKLNKEAKPNYSN